MKIAFVSSEVYPFIKTGGLADVAYALPKALVKQGHDVRVILPGYQQIPQELLKNAYWVTNVDVMGILVISILKLLSLVALISSPSNASL